VPGGKFWVFEADGINAKAQSNLSNFQAVAWRLRVLALNFYAAARAKIALVAGRLELPFQQP